MEKAFRPADCHPTLPHQAKGLCATCYMREWSRSHADRVKARREAALPSECHPEKPTLARGMCGNCYRRWWRANNPEKQKRTSRENQNAAYPRNRMKIMLRRYGMTVEDWDATLESQGHVCAACKNNPAEGRRLEVDHCHRSGDLRGLLCRACNSIAGHADDDLARLAAVMSYLVAPPGVVRASGSPLAESEPASGG